MDRLLVVINSSATLTTFNDWHERNVSSLAWLENLPKPYTSIIISNDIPRLPETAHGNEWEIPRAIRPASFLHHNAIYETRSFATHNGHGHQATYDAQGNLITDTIAAGTADFASPLSSFRLRQHVREDVEPFIRALQLDGNPCIPNFRNDLGRPCLYQGTNLNNYLQVRPPRP